MKRSVSVPGQPNFSRSPMGAVLYMRAGQQSQLEVQPQQEPAPRSRTRRMVSVRGTPSLSTSAAVVRYAVYAREPRCIRAPNERACVQEQICKRHLASHASDFMQCLHVGTYVDIGYAADAPEHHSLERLLIDVLARKIDVVIIAGEWSSVAVNVTNLAKILTTLEAAGVPILSAIGLTDLRSAGGKQLLEMTHHLAGLEAHMVESRSDG